MSKEYKKIDDAVLEKVDGGGLGDTLGSVRQDIRGMIPADVQEKIRGLKDKEEVSRILAENGIDVKKIEKKFTSGLDQFKTSIHQLSDDALNKVSGGVITRDQIKCLCGAGYDDLSLKIFHSFLGAISYDPCTVYKCDKCGIILEVYDDGIEYYREVED